MVATVQVREWNGNSPGVKTDKTTGTVLFKTADDATVDTNNPIVIPSAGRNHSFEKWIRVYISVMPSPATTVSNVNFYSDGANGFGTGVSLSVATDGTYDAGGPVLPSNANSPPEHDAVAMTEVFANYTSGSPLSLSVDSPLATYAVVGECGDFCILVMSVLSTATQGQTPSETLTYTYDES